VLRALTGTGREFRPIFPAVGDAIKSDPGLERPIFDAIDEFEWAAVPRAALFDGVPRLLAGLASRRTLSLVTMQGRRSAEKILQMNDIRRFFSSVFTREDSLDRAEQVNMAIRAMKSDSGNTVFVGDRLNDLNAAKSIGVPFVLLRTHGADPQESDVLVYHSPAEFADSILS
jgi:phosphoglycolate phosphatase-like HAD superfamily hydrolase